MAEHADEAITIIHAVDDRRKQVASRALDVSLNELLDMHHAGELTIRPEYQRLFRWSLTKQSQFIESLILEMPIPPLFVIEIEESKWELIDGLQRISSYLHLRGELESPLFDPPIQLGDTLTLTGCDIVNELNGCEFDDFPAALQIRLKRSFLRVEVIRKETDPRFRYYMFKRLNTGGELLGEQEVRNCVIRLLGDRFNSFIQRLTENEDFIACTESLASANRRRMVDVELVLRFFAFKNDFANFTHDIGPFLTTYMERVTDEQSPDALQFDYTAEEDVFNKVFSVLKTCLGDATCQRWLPSNKYGGGFSMHHYEAFSLGVAQVIEDIDLSDSTVMASIEKALDLAKKHQGLRELTTGGGKNSPGPYRAKIDFVANMIRHVLS